MLSLVLELAQVVAEPVGAADEALAAVEARRPDVALIDVRLRGRDGFALAAELRARDPSLRLVLMTGDVETAAMQERARVLGMQLLAKPFDPADLLALLDAVPPAP